MTTSSESSIDLKCPSCDFVGKNITSLGTHAAMKHGISGEQLYLIRAGLNKPPTCACGCGGPVTYRSLTNGYARFVQNHGNEEFYKARGRKIAKSFEDNPESQAFKSSAEFREKISKARKEGFANGTILNWSDKRINPDVKIWNKGLTTETDERIKEYGKKGSDRLRQMFNDGELETWCKGKTKETDERLKKIGTKISDGYKTGRIKNWWHDPRVYQEISQRISVQNKLSIEEIDRRFNQRANDFTLLDDLALYQTNVTKLNFRCNRCSHQQKMTLHAFERGQLCVYCELFRVSKAQKEIFTFAKSLCPDVILNDRDTIKPLELDLLIPSRRFAIEYNGIYYHSDAHEDFDKDKHQRKTELARSQGISLLHVFEDEWHNKQDIVKSMISHRLGQSSITIGARKCSIEETGFNVEIKEFLNKCHVEGSGGRFDRAFCLKFMGEIVACLTLRKPYSTSYSGYFEIARFAMALNTSAPGAMSRLITSAKRWAQSQGAMGLMTYLDQRFGSQKTYESCGLTFIKETSPRFWWASCSELRRFPRQKFKATKDKSERQVAEEAGVFRIYGCKNSVFKVNF